MSGATLVACDLDRTLIYSPKAFWLQSPAGAAGDDPSAADAANTAVPADTAAVDTTAAAAAAAAADAADAEAPRMIVVELYRGVPISFMTRTAETLLVRLAALAEFVPVTTRTVAQYRRVQLPAPRPAYAVTSNGGVLLGDGVVDARWSATVRQRLASEAAPLPDVRALLGDTASGTAARTTAPWITKLNNAEDLFVYAIVDRTAMPAAWLADLEAEAGELGYAVSVQGRKLYCVPNALTKSAAVAEVRQRLGATTLLAAGDSLLDAPMLDLADLAFRPAHGELHDIGYQRPDLTVTKARGILAGEELLRLLTASIPSRLPAEVRA